MSHPLMLMSLVSNECKPDCCSCVHSKGFMLECDYNVKCLESTRQYYIPSNWIECVYINDKWYTKKA